MGSHAEGRLWRAEWSNDWIWKLGWVIEGMPGEVSILIFLSLLERRLRYQFRKMLKEFYVVYILNFSIGMGILVKEKCWEAFFTASSADSLPANFYAREPKLVWQRRLKSNVGCGGFFLAMEFCFLPGNLEGC